MFLERTYLSWMSLFLLSHQSLSLHSAFTSNFTKSDPFRKSLPAETYPCSGCINRVSALQKHKQTNSWFAPGCVSLPFWVSVCPVRGNRQIGHVLWTTGTVLVEEDHCMGGVVVRRSRENNYRCERRDKRESFRNRIMASCLSARQIVCQVMAALNSDMFIWESGGGRIQKQEQQRALVLFTGITI